MTHQPVTRLDPAYAARSVVPRIWRRSAIAQSGCVEWQGPLDAWGYGSLSVKEGGLKRTTGVHRAAYIAMVSDIPDPRLQVDHLCRNRRCVNPQHLEAVTPAVNTRRSDHSGKRGRSGRRRGNPRGCGKHGMSDGKFSRPDARGYSRWQCRPCSRERFRRWLDAKPSSDST